MLFWAVMSVLCKSVWVHRCVCIHGHVCVFLCVPAAHWACGSALSSFPTVFVPWAPMVTSGQRYGRMPRLEVAGSLPVCQDQIGQSPVWSVELSLWSLSILTSLSLSLSVSFRLCGWCYNSRSQRISSYRRGRCTVWGTLWRWPLNMWGRPLCECTRIHNPISIHVLAISHVCMMLEWAPKVTFL